MKLNTFIHGTADEELMKFTYQDCIDSGKEPPEELVKAMNKAGLVQVQRTVNGKHGQYTRMQWVKSSDVKDSDKVVGGKNPEEEQENVRKIKEDIKNRYANAKNYLDRAKIDIEHVENVTGRKLSEQDKKNRMAFAEHLDKKYGDKKISPEEYGNELKEFFHASSPTSTGNSNKEDKSSDNGKSVKSSDNGKPVKVLGSRTMGKYMEKIQLGLNQTTLNFAKDKGIEVGPGHHINSKGKGGTHLFTVTRYNKDGSSMENSNGRGGIGVFRDVFGLPESAGRDTTIPITADEKKMADEYMNYFEETFGVKPEYHLQNCDKETFWIWINMDDLDYKLLNKKEWSE